MAPLFSSLLAQSTGTLRGVVTDSTNGEALAYGYEFVEELSIGASTDARGYFLIRSIPANTTYNLIVSYVGYNKKRIPVIIVENRMTHLNIEVYYKFVRNLPMVNDQKFFLHYPELGMRIYPVALLSCG